MTEDARCPTCGALPGQPCRETDGTLAWGTHALRLAQIPRERFEGSNDVIELHRGHADTTAVLAWNRQSTRLVGALIDCGSNRFGVALELLEASFERDGLSGDAFESVQRLSRVRDELRAFEELARKFGVIR